MRDLLIRLDQRVSDGFLTLNQKLEAMDRRADGIDSRVKTIEQQIADRPIYLGQHKQLMGRVANLEGWRTEQVGALKAGKAMWAAIVALAGIVGFVGYQIEVAPAPAPTISEAK